MNKRFNWPGIFTLTILVTAILTGCRGISNTNETSPGSITAPSDSATDTSKEVKLIMYLIGEKPADFDRVYDEVNRLLKQDINATVEAEFLSWGEWSRKYPLLFASGDDFDLVYTANWVKYNTEANKGSFLEITQDMVDRYMPKTAVTIYPEAWEQAKINGKVYMLPYNYKEIQGRFITLRGDLLQKYGLTAEEVLKDSKSLEQYYGAFAESGKKPSLLGGGTTWWGMPLYYPVEKMIKWSEAGAGAVGNYRVYYDSTQAAPKVFPFINTDEFVEGVTVTKEWADQGIISTSAMVNKSSQGDPFLNGEVPSGTGNLLTTNAQYIAVNARHPEWKIETFDMNFGNPVDWKPYIQSGMAVNRASKHPERALMMLDLLRNDERYFNLTTYGIEGRHYNLSADGKSIIPLADSVNFPPDSASPWGWREDTLYKSISGSIPNLEQLHDNMLKTAYTPLLQNFVFDDSKVKREIAAINNILDQYEKPLVYGVIMTSVEADIQSLRARLMKAGSGKVVAEMQKQVDAYLAAGNGID